MHALKTCQPARPDTGSACAPDRAAAARVPFHLPTPGRVPGAVLRHRAGIGASLARVQTLNAGPRPAPVEAQADTQPDWLSDLGVIAGFVGRCFCLPEMAAVARDWLRTAVARRA